MTKTVRIENADMNTSKKVVVEVWDKDSTLMSSACVNLGHPTAMTEVTLYDGKYIVIREEDNEAK